MGRKKKAGPRGKTGRLQTWQMRDYGNAVAQARRKMYDTMLIREGKAADEAHDGIGRLWALDLLDGYPFDPGVMRDTARRYAELYWRRNSATDAKTGGAERAGHSKPSLEDSKSDLLMEHWLMILPAHERSVLEEAVVDHWNSDDEAPFVNRLVGLELMERGIVPFANPEMPGDRAKLTTLLRALFALVDGAMPTRVAA